MANTKRPKNAENKLQSEEKIMNDRLKKVMIAKYQAVIEDCKYKIKCYSDHELVIPEHPDITTEIDKLLSDMAEAEDKMAVIELHYGKNEAKQLL